MTPGEVAQMLHVPLDTIYRWRSAGTGPPAMKLGKYLRFAPDDVARWLASRPS
jgi:excisionase family DNA binding protein